MILVDEPLYTTYVEGSLLETGFFEVIDNWKTHNENHFRQKFNSKHLTDEEYMKMKSEIKIMRTAEDYEEYKKAFARFCYFCHIVPRGVIITKIELKHGKGENNSLFVEYTYNTKKVELPENISLYHMSKVAGIKELIPQFRGKSVTSYLYDKPRIYFTIRRHLPKFMADYKFYEKMNVYMCKEKIKYAFVDPLVWTSLQGAVYVETNKPIPVEELTANKAKDIIKDEKEETTNEAFDFDHFLNFVNESGLELL